MAGTAEAPILYAIIQMPHVMERLKMDNMSSAPLIAAIFKLQDDPRPAGSQAADAYGKGMSTLMCSDTVPPFEIVYQVDEEQRRVVVLAISEVQWRT